MSTFRYNCTVNAAQGPALSGVEIFVCTQPANTGTIPPSPLASIFTDSTGSTPLSNPVLTDGLGNAFFYAATGVYTLVYFDSLGRIPITIFPDQQVVSQGGGSVTSVAMTGDGVVFQSAVGGSPINSSGTLVPALATPNANVVLAGPSSGGSGAWRARALVSADLPGTVGTVTSVAIAIAGSGLLSLSSSGGPITTTGTVTLTINFANQLANTILAGPASGSSGAIAARQAVAADICGSVAVAFTATPVFNAALFALPMFTMTLTGNVTSSNVTNPIAGQEINFILTQDGTGGRTFAWPTNFHGASNVDNAANAVSLQSFRYDGVAWRATGPGSVNAT